MKRKISIFVGLIAASLLMAGCSYEAMPPKTADGTSDYVLPKGEVPTEAEMQVVSAAREEYSNWIENN